MLYEKEIQQKKSIKALKSFVCVILASCLMAFNIKTFVRAGELVPGGITGMTLLIQRIMLKYANISVPYSVLNISLNAIPAIIGFKLISKRFTGYSVLMIVLNSFLVDLIPSYKVTTDPLLIALFGGLLNGLAISIALYGKASSGGTDFIAVYIHRKWNISSWNIILGFNIILLTSGMLFGFEASLYSIVFQFVSTQAIDTFHKSDQQMTLFIISNKADELERELLVKTHHGMTRFTGEGSHTHEDRVMLYTVVSAAEVNDVYEIIKSIDNQAFVNIVKTNAVKGRFYQEPID